MGDVVIRAEGLGKKYVIGHLGQREDYETLRDVIARGARNLQRSASNLLRGRPMVIGDETEDLWALKDVSFDIRRSEVVGFIGRNGAGKSTLLKILARITEPTEGRVELTGRVASLLEVGTGFHPELTGRENIFLNGAILGMSQREVRAKFDEIVNFAEVEKFLDTPVKRYSSGMYVRLAFAVAAHLEPEILIVDEVLAVGDFQFQQKCLGKMSEAAHGGRTVLFVSHNIAALASLCDRCIVLDHGTVVAQGTPHETIQRYAALATADFGFQYCAASPNPASPAELLEADLVAPGALSETTLAFRQAFAIRMKWRFSIDAPGANIALRFYDRFGRLTTAVNTKGRDLNASRGSIIELECNIENSFSPGTYFVSSGCFTGGATMLSDFQTYLSFTVSDIGQGGEIFNVSPDSAWAAAGSWSVTQRFASAASEPTRSRVG